MSAQGTTARWLGLQSDGRYSRERSTRAMPETSRPDTCKITILSSHDPQNPADSDPRRQPYLSVADATRLDRVRDALRRGDLKAAASLGRVYRLEPVAPTH